MKKKTIKELKQIKCITSLENYIKKKENIRKFKKECKEQKELAEQKLKAANNFIEGFASIMDCYINTVKASQKLSKAIKPAPPKGRTIKYT